MKVNQMLKNFIACLVSYCVLIPVVHAHHSITAHYDPMDVRTITGRLDSVNWRNPHTIFEFTKRLENPLQLETLTQLFRPEVFGNHSVGAKDKN